MATLYISEYANLGWSNSSTQPQVVFEPPLAEQTIAISGSSTQSSAFNANTRVIRVHPDVICSVLVGTNPTALATSKRMPADNIEYFSVTPGAKIAVITNT